MTNNPNDVRLCTRILWPGKAFKKTSDVRSYAILHIISQNASRIKKKTSKKQESQLVDPVGCDIKQRLPTQCARRKKLQIQQNALSVVF
jgi:hypothetical protein